MDTSTGVRFHFVELCLSTLLRAPVVLLLGLQLQHLLVYELLALPVVLFHHANIGLPERVDRALRCLLVSPRMHRVHHRLEYKYCNSNYSSLLSVWDRIFLTFRPPLAIEQAELGVAGLQAGSLRQMLWLPFRNVPENAPGSVRGDAQHG